MRTIEGLKKVARAYARHYDIPLKTVSYRVFNDGKKLDAIFAGTTDLTTARHDDALTWFSSQWPDAVDWPAGVQRPRANARTSAGS